MSKSLCSMPKAERERAIARRLSDKGEGRQGLGYWAAIDARRHNLGIDVVTVPVVVVDEDGQDFPNFVGGGGQSNDDS